MHSSSKNKEASKCKLDRRLKSVDNEQHRCHVATLFTGPPGIEVGARGRSRVAAQALTGNDGVGIAAAKKRCRRAHPEPCTDLEDPLMISVVLSSCLMLAWADPRSDEPKASAASPVDVVAALETAISDAIARAEPSVVAIHRYKGENSQETTAVRGRKNSAVTRRFLFEGGRMPRVDDLENLISFDFGSGVVIGDQGQIVTMFHVVKGARELVVRAADRQIFKAEIIAADPRSDLAVIAPVESDAADSPKLKPIAIGDAGKLRKGAFLIALGNSFNAARDGKPSASWGILSNIARKLDSSDLDEMTTTRKQLRLLDHPTLLQLDAKLNLGMSGGAVINLKGELVGLTTMAASPAGFDAMAGYAVPMDRMGRRAVETLKEGKEIEYGLLGISPEGAHQSRPRCRDQFSSRPGTDPGQRRDHRRQRRARRRLRFVDPRGQRLLRRRRRPAQDPSRCRNDRAHAQFWPSIPSTVKSSPPIGPSRGGACVSITSSTLNGRALPPRLARDLRCRAWS